MIIKIEPFGNGGHSNQSTTPKQIPEGWAIVPDDIIIPDTFPFVNIEIEEIDNVMVVTEMTEGVVPEPGPEPEPEPTTKERLTAVEEDVTALTEAVERGLSL